MATTHTPRCIDHALGSIVENNADTTAEYHRGDYGTPALLTLDSMLTPETHEYAVEWAESGTASCVCDADEREVVQLAEAVRPFLAVAIERYGSLESAVEHVVALLAEDALSVNA